MGDLSRESLLGKIDGLEKTHDDFRAQVFLLLCIAHAPASVAREYMVISSAGPAGGRAAV
jgi:hypothetical protein